ncbi:MAG: hypothetical protein ABI353_10630, partial [Isosphaeraceae bacterium]
MKSTYSMMACAGLAGAVVLTSLLAGPASPPASAAVPPRSAVLTVLPAQDGAFGTIKGRVVWSGADIPEPKALDNKSKDPEVCGKVTLHARDLVIDPKTKGVMDLFAYIPKATAKNDAAVKALVKEMPEVEIDQKNCEYQPFATVMHK